LGDRVREIACLSAVNVALALANPAKFRENRRLESSRLNGGPVETSVGDRIVSLSVEELERIVAASYAPGELEPPEADSEPAAFPAPAGQLRIAGPR
jgi:hypothetical protein